MQWNLCYYQPTDFLLYRMNEIIIHQILGSLFRRKNASLSPPKTTECPTTSIELTGKGCLATRLWVSTLCFTASELSHGEDVFRLSPIDSRAPDLLILAPFQWQTSPPWEQVNMWSGWLGWKTTSLRGAE